MVATNSMSDVISIPKDKKLCVTRHVDFSLCQVNIDAICTLEYGQHVNQENVWQVKKISNYKSNKTRHGNFHVFECNNEM